MEPNLIIVVPKQTGISFIELRVDVTESQVPASATKGENPTI